jgi:hypothetical protein
MSGSAPLRAPRSNRATTQSTRTDEIQPSSAFDRAKAADSYFSFLRKSPYDAEKPAKPTRKDSHAAVATLMGAPKPSTP